MKVDTTGPDREKAKQGEQERQGRREENERERQKGADRTKINNSQDAAGQKQMALGLHGLSGPWQKPVTHIT